MAYVQPNSTNQRASTLALVAALHAAGFYAILTGLGVSIIPDTAPPIFQGTQFPLDPPKPTPTPVIEPSQRPPTDQTAYVPPPIGGIPPVPLASGDPFGAIGSGGGTVGGTGEEETVIPDPTPDPTPRFTPRNPRVRGDRTRWVTNADYPIRESTMGHEGLTEVRLSVGADGRVTGCDVTASSGWPTLDRATCTWLTRRARFEPATDSSGEVTSGHFNTSVRWRLPDD